MQIIKSIFGKNKTTPQPAPEVKAPEIEQVIPVVAGEKKDLTEFFKYWKEISNKDLQEGGVKLTSSEFLLYDLILGRDPKKSGFTALPLSMPSEKA